MTEHKEIPKVCHLTSVHNRYDPRILKKQCASLVQHGYDVSLLVCNGLENENYQGVKIIDLGKFKNRFHRILCANFIMLAPVRKHQPQLIHFHDPELIPLGLLLKALGYKVIYDIHENYDTDVREKGYLNNWIRLPLWYLTRLAESLSYKYLNTIIAERYYAMRFRESTPILNYPILRDLIKTRPERSFPEKHLLYTGNLTAIRGAEVIAGLLNYDAELEITCIGLCAEEVAGAMYRIAGNNSNRLHLIGVGEYIDSDRIMAAYSKDKWLAGIALFEASTNHENKELTKFFEYMAVGLPILATNFSAWKNLLEGKQVGHCVDITDPERVIAVIDAMYENKAHCMRMSERGKALTDSLYNWESQEQKLASYYSEVLKN